MGVRPVGNVNMANKTPIVGEMYWDSFLQYDRPGLLFGIFLKSQSLTINSGFIECRCAISTVSCCRCRPSAFSAKWWSCLATACDSQSVGRTRHVTGSEKQRMMPKWSSHGLFCVWIRLNQWEFISFARSLQLVLKKNDKQILLGLRLCRGTCLLLRWMPWRTYLLQKSQQFDTWFGRRWVCVCVSINGGTPNYPKLAIFSGKTSNFRGTLLALDLFIALF